MSPRQSSSRWNRKLSRTIRQRSLQAERLENRRMLAVAIDDLNLVEGHADHVDQGSPGTPALWQSHLAHNDQHGEREVHRIDGQDFEFVRDELPADAPMHVPGQIWEFAEKPAFARSAGATGGIPVLNSFPSAAASLYLDFDGHFESVWGMYTNVTTPIFDLDGDPSSFNAEETAYIDDVWRIVAEDFAPFKINVTTVQPSVLAPGVPSSQANGVALRLAIGGTAAIIDQGSGVAGYGYYNAFTNSISNVAYVFPESTTGTFRSSVGIGSVSSHEAGHSFGLRHLTNAYSIANQWQAIMNSISFGYESQMWHTGTDDLGNHQDDMAMLSNSLNGFGYRADDHGGTVAAATPLAGSGANFSGSGIVGAMTDVDVFSLNVAGPRSLKISVQGSNVGQNLDAVVELLDAAGNVIVSANPPGTLDAELFADVSGTAYVAVRSSGAYGYVGQYTITTAESSPGIRVVHARSPLVTSESGTNDSFTVTLNSRPTSNVVIPISSSDLTEGTVSTSQLTFTPANWHLPQTVTVTGVNDGEIDGIVNYTIQLGPVATTDVDYAAISLATIPASNADDDAPGWAFHLSAGTDNIYAYQLAIDPAGNVIVAGSFGATVDFDAGPGTTTLTADYLQDGFVAKYSPTHELIWARNIRGTGGLTYPHALALDAAGNVYIGGYNSSPAAVFGSFTLGTNGSSDAYLAKLDANGNFLWVQGWGGTGSDQVAAIAVDAGGVIHVAGSYTGTVDFNPGTAKLNRTSGGGTDSFVSRFNGSGGFLSTTVFGGPETVYARDIAVDTAGNAYVAGYFFETAQMGGQSLTSAGSSDPYLVKINAAGNIQWARQAAGVPSGATSFVAMGADGTVSFAGNFTESVHFGAGTPTLASAGDSDSFLSRWDAAGNLLQVGQFSGPERVRMGGLEIGPDGAPHILGNMIGVVDLDAGAGIVEIGSPSVESEFLLRLTPEYQFTDVTLLEHKSGSLMRAIAVDARGNIYASNQFTSPSISMPTGDVFFNTGGIDSYFLKLTKAAGIAVVGTSGLQTSESGSSATFTVVLETPPTAVVTIPISSSDLSEGAVSPATLTFAPENWFQPQQVTVTGVDDGAVDGNIGYSIVLGPAVSGDANYHGIDPADVSLVNLDNDVPPVVLYFSLGTSGSVGGLSVADEDIVAFSGSTFTRYFDGSDVGLANFALGAFSIISPTEILMSFTAAGSIPGISGTVDDSDIVKFTATSLGETTAGTFSLYFDGSDVGLTTSGEAIDAIERLAGGDLLISTTGSVSVTGVSATAHDILRFNPTSLGANTAGTWQWYFDGSDVGLSTNDENVDAVALDANGRIYLSTTGNFSVTGRSGADEDVFRFNPTALGSTTAGSYDTQLFFDGSLYGLSSNDVSAIDVPDSLNGGFAVEAGVEKSPTSTVWKASGLDGDVATLAASKRRSDLLLGLSAREVETELQVVRWQLAIDAAIEVYGNSTSLASH